MIAFTCGYCRSRIQRDEAHLSRPHTRDAGLREIREQRALAEAGRADTGIVDPVRQLNQAVALERARQNINFNVNTFDAEALAARLREARLQDNQIDNWGNNNLDENLNLENNENEDDDEDDNDGDDNYDDTQYDQFGDPIERNDRNRF